MQRSLLTGVFLFTFCLLRITVVRAQDSDTTHPVSIDPELLALENAKTPHEYTIAGIKITGSKYLDEFVTQVTDVQKVKNLIKLANGR